MSSTRKPISKAEALRRQRLTGGMHADGQGFDITCVIGEVRFAPAGAGVPTPYENAFEIIGRHGAPGTYTFPEETGGTVTVDVQWTRPS